MTNENENNRNKVNQRVENQLKYAQQHLANERTYLAWVRTALAVIGIVFLTTELYFSSANHGEPFNDRIAIFLEVSAGLIGIILIIVSTINYVRQKRQIENQEFYPGQLPALSLSILLIMVALIAVSLSLI